MKKEYDVIIVGAGVAGLMLAKLLNNSKLKVLLVEKRKKFEKLSNHQFATFKDTIQEFRLQKYVIKKYKNFGFHPPQAKADFKYDNYEFQVVDMNTFAKQVKLKCDIKTGFTVKDMKRINNKIRLTDGKKTFEAKMIVDCSGDERIISQKLGMELNTIDMWDKMYLLTNCNIPYHDLWLYITDTRYANFGFWYYPFNKKTCILGHTEIVTRDSPIQKKHKDSIDYFMRDVEPYKTWFKNAKILEEVRKIGPTTTILPTFAEDNILLCGDAAGTGTPLVGDGFATALQNAKSAYETIQQAFEKKDFSKKYLSQHPKAFHRQLGKYYKWSKVLRFISIRYWTNNEWNMFAENLRRNMDEKTFLIAFKSRISFWILLKSLSVKLLIHTGMNAFKYYLKGPLTKRVVK